MSICSYVQKFNRNINYILCISVTFDTALFESIILLVASRLWLKGKHGAISTFPVIENVDYLLKIRAVFF